MMMMIMIMMTMKITRKDDDRNEVGECDEEGDLL